ncbi:hypothetical protein F443_12268 [Phytophthora nicotianae P1569]|uniref:ZSWIM1/3 RNaseH-like domain-containing protein n=1 Tax=Phytophthora nicotianae P1569 TaxID=1317065 RepID=V9EVR7_PHYNI|nr:hypothetical protein F443_12268 [Phytophthora nicotianae P1569]
MTKGDRFEAGSVSETAPSFQRWHDTWDDFFKNLRQYEAQTSQLYRIRTCTRVSTRNDKIRKKKKWREGGLVPECFGDYYKKLLCMHGWVSRCPTTNSWRICVTTHNRTHNHRLRKEVYANYPSTRRVMDPDVLDFVDELIKAGAKPKRILKYLQETTDKRVILRDVHNLGQYIQLSLVENDSHACMKDAIEALKGNNPTWDRIRVFMIDKDFGELSLLQKEFLLARAVYGGRNAVDVDRVEDAVDMMSTTKGKDDLESAWGLLKEILKPEMELDECVETLVFLQSTAELDYAPRFNVIGSRHYHGADDMLLRLAGLVSPHAFELVYQENELLKSGVLSYEGGWLQDGIVRLEIRRTGREYTVNVSAETNRPEEDESDEDISCSSLRVQTAHMRSVEHAVLNGTTKWKTAMDIAGASLRQ